MLLGGKRLRTLHFQAVHLNCLDSPKSGACAKRICKKQTSQQLTPLGQGRLRMKNLLRCQVHFLKKIVFKDKVQKSRLMILFYHQSEVVFRMG